MPRVESYKLDNALSGKEYVLGTDVDRNNKTSSYLLSRIKEYILGISKDSDNQLDGIPNGDGTFTWLKYSLYNNGRVGETSDGEVSMSDLPLDGLPLYIGLAYNKSTNVESDIPEDYIWSDVSSLILDANGRATWVKYADTPTSGMSDNPLGKAWIGLSFDNDPSLPESTDFGDYRWSKVLGNDGVDGIPVAGTTLWVWVKHSEYEDGMLDGVTNMVDDPTSETTYIGIAYNKDTHIESDDAEDYIWSDGEGNILQADGKYTWVKYATTPNSGMSDLPEGKRYIGLAFDKVSKKADDPDSLLFSSYQWSSMYMETDGGETYITNNFNASFTWLKFSEHSDGFSSPGVSSMTDEVQASTQYIGIGVNKKLPESEDPDSDDPTEYDWTLKGEDIIITIDGRTYYIWDKWSAYENGKLDGVTNMQNLPDLTTEYVGLAYYKEVSESADLVNSNNADSYQWTRVIGDIEKISVLYQWMKFADLEAGGTEIDESTMNDSPTGLTHQGFAFNKELPEIADPDSDKREFYIWTLKGADIELPDGTFVWDKYSIYPAGRDGIGDISMQDDIDASMLYIGLKYGEDVAKSADIVRSDNPDIYTWSSIDDIQSTDFLFYWIKFANGITGKDLSNYPQNRSLMGIGYNKSTFIEGNDADDYVWNDIEKIQWYTGIDGQRYATWVKWTDNPSNGDLLDQPIEGSQYMGLAFGKTEAETIDVNGDSTESLDYKDYQWFRFDFENADGVGDFNQDNKVVVLKINPEDLLNNQITEDNTATYLNDNGLNVSERENYIFDFGDGDNPPALNFLDQSIDLTLVVGDIGETTADLSWSDGADDPNGFSYILYYRNVDTNGNYIPIEENEELSDTLTSLTQNTNYSAYVVQYSLVAGDTKISNTVTFITDATVVEDKPTIWNTTLSDVTIGLEWNMTDPNFTADNYKLYQVGNATAIFDGFDTTFLVTGLTQSTLYQYYVVAYEDGTPSTQSDTIDVTTDATVTPTLHAPSLAWTARTSSSFDFLVSHVPAYVLDNAVTDTWLVGYRLASSTSSWSSFSLTNDKTEIQQFFSIIDLIQSTDYSIRVKAQGAGYVDSPYTTISLKTLAPVVEYAAEIDVSTVDSGIIDPYGVIKILRATPNSVVNVAVEVSNNQLEPSVIEFDAGGTNAGKEVSDIVSDVIILAIGSDGTSLDIDGRFLIYPASESTTIISGTIIYSVGPVNIGYDTASYRSIF